MNYLIEWTNEEGKPQCDVATGEVEVALMVAKVELEGGTAVVITNIDAYEPDYLAA